MKTFDLLKQWRLAVNEKVQMKPLPENLEWFKQLVEETNKLLENGTDCIGLYGAPCHCDYDEDRCCGIFNLIKDNTLKCNECGTNINDLVKGIASKEASVTK